MRNRTILSLIILFTLVFAFAQKSVKELEATKQNLQQQIDLTNKMLNQTSQAASSKLKSLQLMKKQIDTRKSVIRNLEGEIVQLNGEQNKLERQLTNLEYELILKQRAYGSAMQNLLVKKSDTDKLLFILSAPNFTKSIRRARYIKEYTTWLKIQGEEIKEKQIQLANIRKDLIKTKSTKVNVLGQQEKEKDKLQNVQKKEQVVYNDLAKKKKQLQADLTKQRRQADELNRQIKRIIEEEARRAAADAAKNNNRTSKTRDGYAMTKEEMALSNDFSKNQGKLPMPLVGKYLLIGRYGEHPHPVLKNVKVNNSGVDLQTTPGTDACAVFNGEVSKVFKVQGFSYSIIIRHGNYLTVYSNLSSVYVKAGSRVSTRQAIGRIYTNNTEGEGTVLHFQIWKETSKLNPESWLNM